MSTVQAQVGRRLLVGFEGKTAPEYILQWLREGRIGGVILFARNVESPAQLAALTRSLHAAAAQPILVATDQEGGMVTRLKEAQGFTESPGAMAIAAATDAAQHSQAVSQVLADEMHALGINWTYAPVVDLSYNADNPTVGTRSYGRDPQRVGELAAAAVQGFQAGNVAACAKHFPGLGDTAEDTHISLPALDTAVDDLIADDLEPYRQIIAADCASIMTTHTIFTALDDEHPATLSPHVIQRLLREELSYNGVVVTDCLEMQAITDHYGAGEAAVLAALAGVDILLVSHTRARQEAAFDALLAAAQSGRLSDEHLQAADERIQAMQARFAVAPDAIDSADVGSDAHHQVTDAAARAGVILARKSKGYPLTPTMDVGLIEFTAYRDSLVRDDDSTTPLAKLLNERITHLRTVALHGRTPDDDAINTASELAAGVDVLVIATRNAHRIPAQRKLAAAFLATNTPTVLVCLQNPYDADVLFANSILCTCGDSVPSLRAVTAALMGDYTPSGSRPTRAAVDD